MQGASPIRNRYNRQNNIRNNNNNKRYNEQVINSIQITTMSGDFLNHFTNVTYENFEAIIIQMTQPPLDIDIDQLPHLPLIYQYSLFPFKSIFEIKKEYSSLIFENTSINNTNKRQIFQNSLGGNISLILVRSNKLCINIKNEISNIDIDTYFHVGEKGFELYRKVSEFLNMSENDITIEYAVMTYINGHNSLDYRVLNFDDDLSDTIVVSGWPDYYYPLIVKHRHG